MSPAPIQTLVFTLTLASLTQAAESKGPQPFNTEPATTLPLSPTDAAMKAVLPDGFHMSVFAAEPDVQQPISMATDPQGRLWVAENYTYSESKVGYHPELRDRIVVFEDANNDGHFDKRTVFWDEAQRLTSVEVGLGGVWALALPNLVFIPDANGDGIPDGPPRVILDGFEYQRGRHTVANGLRWGPDGWLYGRHGIQTTSQLGAPGTPDNQRVAMNVGVWRYHPGRKVVEVVAQGTTNPWGMDWDAEGEPFFINTVIGHLWHGIPGAHYRRMYGDDPTPFTYELIEQHADHVHWAQGEVWTDVRKGVTDVTLAAGGGHAHTGLLIYQGGQWPPYWNGKLLTINFHGRRLNVERLDPQGSGFVGRREPDAFLSADPWFRGIDLIPAPDGSVFLSDWSDTGECHDHDGIHRTSGRIYKIQYGTKPTNSVVDLSRASDATLVARQASSNNWEARTARAVLASRFHQGADLAQARIELRTLAEQGTDPIVRLRCLWALHVSGGIDLGLLRSRLSASPAERAWAIRLLEDSRHDTPEAAKAFEAWVTKELTPFAKAETSARVRLVLASLLHKLPIEQRIAAAEGLLTHSEDNEDHNLPLVLWYALAPIQPNAPGYIEAVVRSSLPRVQRLAARRIAEFADTDTLPLNALIRSLASAAAEPSRLALLEGIADGFAGRRRVTAPTAWADVARNLSQGAPANIQARIRDLSALFGDGRALDQIREIVLNTSADLPRRRAALQSLVEARADGLRAVCEQVLPIRELSATAAAGLALFDAPEIADRLIAEWPNLYGHERPPVLNALLSRPTWAGKVLTAIQGGKFRRTDLGVAQARQIRGFNQPALTQQLADVWGALSEPTQSDREAALAQWKSRLAPTAIANHDPTAGRIVFRNTCGACHKLYGEGGALGPDLTGSGRQNVEYLLDNILFPNAVVPAEFRQTTLQLKDGRTLTGILRNRTAKTRVIDMVGQSETVDATDIEKEEVGTNSLMPEGLLNGLKEKEALDLFAYLMSTAPPSGNQ